MRQRRAPPRPSSSSQEWLGEDLGGPAADENCSNFTGTISARFTPKTGLAGLAENWRADVLSGFLVFLIALPYALASRWRRAFPPQAGIITAIVGGLLVSRINGSFVTITGPAAGLIVVILDSVQDLGDGDAMAGYHYTLAAIVCASVIQILMGMMKAGKMSAFFPSSAVHGMLAAIGIIIMAKQIYVMLGVKPDARRCSETIGAIPASLRDMNPEVAIIGGIGLLILILGVGEKSPTKDDPAPRRGHRRLGSCRGMSISTTSMFTSSCPGSVPTPSRLHDRSQIPGHLTPQFHGGVYVPGLPRVGATSSGSRSSPSPSSAASRV